MGGGKFLFNASFEPEKVIYDNSYDNSQNYSAVFQKHEDDVIDFISSNIDITNKNVLEVGCGQGEFLKRLASKKKCNCIGFDPSFVSNNLEDEKHISVFTEYFNKLSYTKIKHPVKLVIWRNVIGQVPDPLEAIKDIVNVFEPEDDFYLYIETPDADWILSNGMYYDIVYEYRSIFTIGSLESLLNRVGLEVVKSGKMFEEKYLAVLAKPAKDIKSTADISEKSAETELHQTMMNAQKVMTFVKYYLTDLKKSGGVCVWGAAAKGIMFVNMYDENRQFIDCLCDINPNKQGGFVAHTAHPIIAPDKLIDYNIKTILVLNSNYVKEIREYEYIQDNGFAVIDFEMMMKKISGINKVEN
ncbi:MAG TPA: class I SAM-dependent methyltransferase [Methanocorpusculum sp.]|nr:class I SAM-dependent methyltransferase [Methanocorpusculum sp.]